MPAAVDIKELQNAGFTDEEISQWAIGQRKQLQEAGFSDAEIDTYFGQPPFDPKPIKQFVQGNLQKAAQAPKSPQKDLQPTQEIAQAPQEALKTPGQGESRIKPVSDFLGAVEAGLQVSVSGLLARGEQPDKILSQDASRTSRIASSMATLAGDFPFMFGGAFLGGGPITGTAAAFALPQGLRRILMDKYTKGEVSTFGEFWDRLAGATIDTVKGWLTGAATGAAGKAAGTALESAPTTVRAAGTAASEIATMVTVGNALEGKVPDANEFIDAAIVVGGLKGAGKLKQKFQRVYEQTNVRPSDVVSDAQRDVTIQQDLASSNITVPKSYEDPALDALTKLRRVEQMTERRLTGKFVEIPASAPSIMDLAKGTQYAVKKTSPAGTFRNEPASTLQPSQQEGSIVTRPRTPQDELKQYAALGLAEVHPTPVEPHDVFDPSGAPYWYKQLLVELDTDTRRLDGLIDKLRQTGHAATKDEQIVESGLLNAQNLIFAVEALPKSIPDTQLSRAEYDKPRFLRTAEELLQEKNKLKTAEDMIPQTPRSKIRETYVIVTKREGPSDETIGRDLDLALRKEGFTFGEEAPPKWEQKLAIEGADETVKSKISIGQETPKEPMTWNKLYTQIVDDLNPIRELMGETAPTKVADDPYRLAHLTRGTFGKADHMLEFGTFDFRTYKNNGKALKDILEPVRNNLDDLRTYAVAKRTIELSERGVDAGVDVLAAKQVLKNRQADGTRSMYDAILTDLVEYQNHLTQYLRDSGVLSPDIYEAMKEANKNYVPFYRVMDETGRWSGPKTSSGLQTKQPIKKITGSERVIVDPIESVVKNTYVYTALAERNAVGQALVKWAKDTSNTELVKPVGGPKRSDITDAEIKAFLDRYGIAAAPEATTKAFIELRKPVGDNQIAVYEDGKRVLYEVSPDVAAAFKGTDAETTNLLLKILAVPAKTLRAGSVLSPDFMVRNFSTDQVSAFILSKHGYVPLLDFLRGAFSLAKKDTDFQNWLKGGGANAALVSVDRQYVQEHIFKLAGETGLFDRALNVVKSPLEMLRVTGELIENATRLGEFKKATQGATDKATVQEGAYDSREVTLNYSRVGSKMRAVNMISAFTMAQITGVDRVFRAFAERPMNTAIKIGAAVTLPSILLWLANHDDPRWKEVPQWQKDMFWIVMTDEHIYRIKKPFEMGVVFGSATERVLEAYYDHNPQAFKALETAIIEAFVPNLVPNAAAPLVEQFSNRSLFTGNPVIPSHMEGLMPEYQYTDYTTETSKALGQLFGAFPGMEKRAMSEGAFSGVARALTTPILLENYLRGWTGGLGLYALQIADKGLREASVVPDPVLPAKTLADIPFIKAFVVRYPSASAQSIQDFYDNYYTKKKVYDTWKAKAAEGDALAVEHIATVDPALWVQLDAIRETLTQQSQLVRMVYKNPDIPPGEKRQLIDTMYMNMIGVAKGGNTALEIAEKALTDVHK